MTITRVVAKNFKSLKNCEIELSPLTVLVGENSSGKSSVLQVLGFLEELEQLDRQSVGGNLAPLNAGTFKLGTFDQLASTSSMTLDGPNRMELGRTRSTATRRRSLGFELEPSDTPGQAIIYGVKSGGNSLISLPQHLASSIADEIREAVGSRSESLSEDLFAEEDVTAGGRSGKGSFTRTYRPLEDEESLALRFIDALEAGEVYVEDSDLDKVSDRRRGRFFTVTTAGPEDEIFVESYSVAQMEFLRGRILGPLFRSGQRGQHAVDAHSETAEKEVEKAIDYEELMTLTLRTFDDAKADDRGFWEFDAGDTLKVARGLLKTKELAIRFFEDVEQRLQSSEGPPVVSRSRRRRFTSSEMRLSRDSGFGRTTYLSGLRSKPSPISAMNFGRGLVPLGSQGEYEAAVRENFKRKQVRCPMIDETGKSNFEEMDLNDAVGFWLGRFGIAKAVTSELQGNIGYGTELVDIQTNEARDPTFYGVGASQLLPVLTLCLLAEPGDTVLIEQPELHVHPGPQQILGDFLLGITEGGVQVVVETHSEYLVNRLRRRMVEDPTSKLEERVSILYASRVEGSTTFERLKPTPDGSFEYWPDGFFDQGANEAEQIMRAVISKRRADQSNT